VLSIPPFEPTGRLPAGVHSATGPRFVERFATSARRLDQLRRLEAGLRLLQEAGCARVFVGGSFVAAKSDPNDVDAEVLDPIFLDFRDERAAQRQRFGAEFFPAQLVEGLTGRSFLRFFQYTRNDEPVGIVAVDLRTIA
jgi:uncharacterized protein DUF6932